MSLTTLLTLVQTEISIAAFGFVSGLLIYLSGVGGGVVVVPSLLALFSLPTSVAIGTASVFSCVCKVGAGISHARLGNVSGSLLARFLARAAVSCLVSAGLVVALSHLFPHTASVMDFVLKTLELGAGTFAIVSMYLPSMQRRSGRLGLPRLAILTGALIGATGTGGGVLVVPALMSTSGESPHRVIGTSILIGLALSAITALVLGAAGNISWRHAAFMSVGALLALPVGRQLFPRLSGPYLKGITAVLAALAMLGMAWTMRP
ncbi:MAG: sulfite exporter TauE/SafE family protein [Polaromonas sp.]